MSWAIGLIPAEVLLKMVGRQKPGFLKILGESQQQQAKTRFLGCGLSETGFFSRFLAKTSSNRQKPGFSRWWGVRNRVFFEIFGESQQQQAKTRFLKMVGPQKPGFFARFLAKASSNRQKPGFSRWWASETGFFEDTWGKPAATGKNPVSWMWEVRNRVFFEIFGESQQQQAKTRFLKMVGPQKPGFFSRFLAKTSSNRQKPGFSRWWAVRNRVFFEIFGESQQQQAKTRFLKMVGRQKPGFSV